MEHSRPTTTHTIGYGTLAFVWMILMDLTALTVILARVEEVRYKVVTSLAVACMKAALVIWFFMHMKYEGRVLRWFLFLTLVTLATFIGLTFFDTNYR